MFVALVMGTCLVSCVLASYWLYRKIESLEV